MAADAATLKERTLDQLRVGDEGVLILARVLRAERRDVVRKSDGGRRPVLTGLLTDNTASLRFTWWDPPANGQLESGTVFRAGPVSVREFRGKPELTFNWKTRFAEASEGELPPVRVAELPVRTVATLRSGDEAFRLDGRVVRVARKTVKVGEEPREILEGILADSTGTCAFTAWTTVPLTAGSAVRLSGVSVREFGRRTSLVLDERSRIDPLPTGSLPPLESLISNEPRSIAQVEASGGGALVHLAGRIVGLSSPSGLVFRCPDCRRAVRDGRCRVHGSVVGVPDLRVRLVLDDGTGAAVVNLDREATEREWGHSLADALAAQGSTPSEAIGDEVLRRLLGQRREVSGRATVDEFGITVDPESWNERRPPAHAREATP
jgi:replication factor A1